MKILEFYIELLALSLNKAYFHLISCKKNSCSEAKELKLVLISYTNFFSK